MPAVYPRDRIDRVDPIASGKAEWLTRRRRSRSRPLSATRLRRESATAPMVVRSRDEIETLFSGWRLLQPGVVPAWQWRSEPGESPRTEIIFGGAGVKDG